jgi:hypothetical protein
MTTGEVLKKQLGLSKFKSVRLHRCIDCAIPTYFIYVNSRSTLPITNARVTKNPGVANIYNGNKLPQESIYTPLMDIEKFNAVLRGRIFVLVDLAGMNLINDKVYENTLDLGENLYYKYSYYPNFKMDEITLFDLRDKDLVSDTTNKYKKIRQKYNKTANINTKLIESEVKGNDVTFKFLAEATDDPNDDSPKKEVDPSGFKMKDNPSRTYEIWLKFPNALELLELQDKDALTRKDIKNLLEASDVQLWSNSPSFHYQGFNYFDSQLDASIFPTNIAPKQWDKVHGDGKAFLDKHTAQLIEQIGFFLNPMSSMLTKELKDQGKI